MKKLALLFAIACLLPTVVLAEGDVTIDDLAIRVVDAETGKPLVGAVVARSYPVYVRAGSNLHEGTYYEQSGDLQLSERYTDADGWARFDVMTVSSPGDALLYNRAPQVLVFKQGYSPLRNAEEPRTDHPKNVMKMPRHIRSALDEMTIELERESSEGLSRLDIQQLIGFIDRDYASGPACRWKHVPMLAGAIGLASETRPALEARFKRMTDTPTCRTGPLELEVDDESAQLQIDVTELRQLGGKAESKALPVDAILTVSVPAFPDESGFLFFKVSDEETRFHIRYSGEPTKSGPVTVRKGQTLTVEYINLRQKAVVIEPETGS